MASTVLRSHSRSVRPQAWHPRIAGTSELNMPSSSWKWLIANCSRFFMGAIILAPARIATLHCAPRGAEVLRLVETTQPRSEAT